MKLSSQPLRPSPYLARRDPTTGQWLIIKPNAVPINTEDASADQEEVSPAPACLG